MSEPKREAVAGNCSEHRGNEQRPRVIPAAVASALIARISVEPGTTVPITGTASDSASRKTATNDSCGCAPTKSTNGEKYEVMSAIRTLIRLKQLSTYLLRSLHTVPVGNAVNMLPRILGGKVHVSPALAEGDFSLQLR